LAIWNGRIIALGSNPQVQQYVGAATTVVELNGARVVPGFIDAHVHLLGGGLQLLRVDLKDAKNEAEFGQRLREYDQRTPRERWLLGGNWDHERTFGGRLPTAELLDKYVPHRPAFLRRYDGHMGVANSAALRLCGITAQTQDVPGGVIDRDASGRPTGLLRDNAMSLVEQHIPEPDEAEIDEAVRAALAHAAAMGVTGVDDMDGSSPQTRQRLLRVLQRLARSGRLTCRIHLRWPLGRFQELATLGIERGFGDEWLRIGGVKGFVDGSLGSSTARMFEPYEGVGTNRGVYVTPPELLRRWIDQADAAGLHICVHAIGDEANAVLLDIFAAVHQQRPNRERRWRIEHAQHLRPNDYPRFHQLGVIASMQPYHVVDDGRWAESRIGARRCASSYAFRSLLQAKAVLAFGSDWPVAPLSPLLGIEAAVHRRTLDGRHPHGWFPQQRISVVEAVRAYTWGSAYATGTERQRGTLAVGQCADFVVLDRDIFAQSELERLGQTQVVRTVVAGKTVYVRH
jgi:predicted amidohydrolase YtcJ